MEKLVHAGMVPRGVVPALQACRQERISRGGEGHSQGAGSGAAVSACCWQRREQPAHLREEGQGAAVGHAGGRPLRGRCGQAVALGGEGCTGWRQQRSHGWGEELGGRRGAQLSRHARSRSGAGVSLTLAVGACGLPRLPPGLLLELQRRAIPAGKARAVGGAQLLGRLAGARRHDLHLAPLQPGFPAALSGGQAHMPCNDAHRRAAARGRPRPLPPSLRLRQWRWCRGCPWPRKKWEGRRGRSSARRTGSNRCRGGCRAALQQGYRGARVGGRRAGTRQVRGAERRQRALGIPGPHRRLGRRACSCTCLWACCSRGWRPCRGGGQVTIVTLSAAATGAPCAGDRQAWLPSKL